MKNIKQVGNQIRSQVWDQVWRISEKTQDQP